jgi:hypothetical protein
MPASVGIAVKPEGPPVKAQPTFVKEKNTKTLTKKMIFLLIYPIITHRHQTLIEHTGKTGIDLQYFNIRGLI